jgi:hypothetical protein
VAMGLAPCELCRRQAFGSAVTALWVVEHLAALLR